jgi:hypothetical protein
MSRDPFESFNDASPEVRALIDAGIADEVDDYDVEGGLAAHFAAIGVVPGAAVVHGLGAAPRGVSTLSASAKGLAVLGGAAASTAVLVALWFGFARPRDAPQESSESRGTAPKGRGGRDAPQESSDAHAVAPSGNGETATNSIAAPEPASHPSEHRGRRSAKPDADDAPTLPLANSASFAATPTAATPMANPEKSALIAATAAPETNAEDRATAKNDTESATASAESAEERRDRAEKAQVKADERLELDMKALMQAKRALAEDPAKALSLARQGEREFPKSMFGEERRALLLLAMIRVGQVDSARRLAAPYLAEHPDSPFARRVRHALDAAATH